MIVTHVYRVQLYNTAFMQTVMCRYNVTTHTLFDDLDGEPRCHGDRNAREVELPIPAAVLVYLRNVNYLA